MKRINILRYAGIAAAAVFIIMTLAAHLNSTSMGPTANWLSEYGNPLKNPAGAIFYNIGCIAAALLFAVFFMGMMRWHKGAPKKLVVCYICAEASGLTLSVFMLLASLIPAGTSPAHEVLSTLSMAGMDCFLVSTAVAAFINPYTSGGIGALGIAAAAFNIFTRVVPLGRVYIADWVFFLAFLVYIILLTVSYERFRGENIKAAQEREQGIAG